MRNRVVVWGVVLGALAAPGVAHAEEPLPPPPPMRDLSAAWGFSLDVFARRLIALPRLTLAAAPVEGLRSTRGTLAAGEGVSMLGIGTGSQIVFNDRWILPLTSFDFAFATGHPPDVISGLDGSIARERLATAKIASMGILGFGVRGKHRRWMTQVSLVPGVSVLFTSAEIANGRESVPVTTHAISFSLRATVEGCRRLDPETRACLFVAPSIYEFGAFNGGAIGIRLEMGP